MHFSWLYIASSWLSHDLFMTVLGLSLYFLITSVWLFYDFFMTSPRISHDYLLPFYDFLMTFLWLFMTFSWLSCDFLKTLRRNKLVLLLYYFSLHQPSEPIQSLSCNVRELCVCVSLLLRKTLFPVDWRLLGEESIANIGIPQDVFFLFFFFANQATVQNEGVRRGRVCGCGFWS